ncbi:MAG: DMT family transporter, partial [Limnothrix sp.]
LTIRNYAAIAYTTAAIFLLPMPWLFGVGYRGYSLGVYGYIFAMTAIAQLFGHTSLNWSLRWLSPVTVTLLVLCEPVIASILGFFVLKEIPSLSVIMGGCIIFLGVAIAVFPSKKNQRADL